MLRGMRESLCPTCRKTFKKSEARPFCSVRCRTIDLGDWLGEAYRMEALPPDDLDPALIEKLLEGPDA